MKINEQERRKIDADERGNPLMTVKTIKYYCYKEYLFQTPELNEKLYLHYKGFKKIQSLENYPNLVTIWLNNNCISKIEGLGTLKNLICLYLNNNIISKIQNLEGLEKLSILHLAHNRIDKIEGLGSLKVLNILNVSENFLCSAQSILGLKDSSTLTGIDLSKNQLQNSNEVFNIISSLQNMSCINMKNTLLSKYYKNYRKKLTCHLKKLTFLDDRPVKVIDHRLAEAWMKGGAQFQNQQRLKIAEEVKQKNIRENIQLNQRIKRQQMKNQQIRNLEVQIKNIEGYSDNEQKEQYRKQIQRRLDILKDGPKGFQALITDTSIKILQVKEEQQNKIIDKYFFRQKKKIQENLKRVEKQKMSIKEANIGEDENKIEQKIKQIFGLNKQKQERTKRTCSQKWNKKYQPILEALLYKEKFNFETVTNQFNKIMRQVGQKTMKVSKKFQIRELQYIWTQIQQKRKQEMQLQEKKIENLQKIEKERINKGQSSQYQDQDIII